MSTEDNFITDDGLKDFALSLLFEVMDLGESEAAVLSSPTLREEEQKAIMKANAMLAVLTMVLTKLVTANNSDVTRTMYDVWNSPDMRDILSVSFEEERAEARELMDNLVSQLEDAANEETNDAPISDND